MDPWRELHPHERLIVSKVLGRAKRALDWDWGAELIVTYARSGRTTVCLLLRGDATNGLPWVGVAHRHFRDKESQEVGRDVALSRAASEMMMGPTKRYNLNFTIENLTPGPDLLAGLRVLC